ncbi:MAG: DMT family transporter [Alphaproteobacteria bacterium]|nr:DMT family transporter [Alphaproteobacteria bacterium]
MAFLPLRERFSVPVYSAGLLVLACVGFAAMNAIIRHLATNLAVEPLMIVFCRNFFAFLVMVPWLMRGGAAVMKTNRLPLISLRALIGFLSMALWFSALAIVPLSNAVALSFTAPLFAAVAAVLILGEVIRARRMTALAIGFIGMLVILRPGSEPVGWGELIVVFSAATMALSVVTMKLLTRTEATPALVVWQNMLLTPVSFLPALLVWSWPSAEGWFWLVTVGVIATLSHLVFTRAFSLANTTYLLPFDYIRLPIVAIIGWFAFSEPTDMWTWIGAAIIASSTVYVAHRESKMRSAGAAAEAVGSPDVTGRAVPPRDNG